MLTYINWRGRPIVGAPGIYIWRSNSAPTPSITGGGSRVGGQDIFYALMMELQYKSVLRRMYQRNHLRKQRLEKEQTERKDRHEAEVESARQRSIWSILVAEI